MEENNLLLPKDKIINISIILPVYNCEDYILDCLKSIENQTYPVYEVIIIDDASLDSSKTIIKDFLKFKKKFVYKLIENELNRGLSIARNIGIKKALGDYIYFIDSDDLISKDCIETLINVLKKNPKSQMIYGSFIRFKNIKKIEKEYSSLKYRHLNKKEEIKKMILSEKKLPNTVWNILIDRDWIFTHNLFFPEGLLNEDLYWNFFAAKYVNQMSFTNRITYYYRYNEKGITFQMTSKKYIDNLTLIIKNFIKNIDTICLWDQIFLILRKIHTCCVYTYNIMPKSSLYRYVATVLYLPLFFYRLFKR